MYKKLQSLISLVMFTMPMLSHATSAISLCPEQILPLQTLEHLPKGWTALSEQSPSRLTNVGFYDGHPDKQAELAPTGHKTLAKRFINQWKFIKLHNDQIWIRCRYVDTNVSLVKPLDGHISSCSAGYDLRTAPPQLTDISCK